MRLSMVMIARNERENVRPCFESFWPWVNQVVLCDTGSSDGTVAEARRFARDHGRPGKLIVGRFKWCDDFAAARNHAHSLATGDVHCSMDLDDRLIGGESLRGLAERLLSRPEVAAISAAQSGPRTAGVWRERLLRPPVLWRWPVWEEPVHEHGEPVNVTTRVRWEHARTGGHGRRDIDIALRWAAEDPTNFWPLLVAAHEARGIPDWEMVEDCCRRGLRLRPDADRHAAFCLLAAQALRGRGDGKGAVGMAGEAISALSHVVTRERHAMEDALGGELDLNGTKSDAWLFLGWCASDRQDHLEVLRCAHESATYALTQERVQAAHRLASDEAVIVLGPVEAMRLTAGHDAR